MIKYAVIIPAAGNSNRFKKNKLTLKINNDYIINHTVYPFIEDQSCEKIVIVTNTKNYQFLKDLYKLVNKILVVKIDSLSRSESVKFGLSYVSKNEYVLIHDACRPYVNLELITRITTELSNGFEAVIPTIPVADSLIDIKKLAYLNREDIRRVQTPQGFKTNLLINAFNNKNLSTFNDEFSLVLHNNSSIKYLLVEGQITNKKITWSEDINIIEYDEHNNN